MRTCICSVVRHDNFSASTVCWIIPRLTVNIIPALLNSIGRSLKPKAPMNRRRRGTRRRKMAQYAILCSDILPAAPSRPFRIKSTLPTAETSLLPLPLPPLLLSMTLMPGLQRPPHLGSGAYLFFFCVVLTFTCLYIDFFTSSSSSSPSPPPS
jgi:hypothetical protein